LWTNAVILGNEVKELELRKQDVKTSHTEQGEDRRIALKMEKDLKGAFAEVIYWVILA